MPIDPSVLDAENSRITHTKLASLVFPDLGGVEVACLRYQGENYDSYQVVTDENFYREFRDGEWVRVSRNDTELYHHCKEARERATSQWMAEFRAQNQDAWSRMEPKEIVFDIAERVWAGEWLGQHSKGVIYAQEVAQLMGIEEGDEYGFSGPIWDLLDLLKAEERIDLNGAILQRYKMYFRFPDELRHVIAYMVEEPLGWPNGEAGDGAVWMLESAIDRGTQFKHGKDLVWEHNFPHIAPRLLLTFGTGWVRRAAQAAEQGNQDAPDAETCRHFADLLETVVQQLRSVGERSQSEG